MDDAIDMGSKVMVAIETRRKSVKHVCCPILAFAIVTAAGCVEPVPPARFGQLELAVEGRVWPVRVWAPAEADERALPLVILLHGTGGDGETILAQGDWLSFAERECFVVAAPTAPPYDPDRMANLFTNPAAWNSGGLWRSAPREDVDDLVFFATLLDELTRQYAIDESRVYVVGHSNGGSMALRVAAAFSDRVAAVASVAGPPWGFDDRGSATPVPTLFVFGDADPLVPLDGGLVRTIWGQRVGKEIITNVLDWAWANGCSRDFARRDEGVSAARMMVAGCTPGADTELILLRGHGHTWPRSGERASIGVTIDPQALLAPFQGPQTKSFDATEETWRFVSRFRKH
jgi:polyhydroxybutyrate depolymerase